MTPRRKHGQAMLRITQVHSRIGNQERVVRVLTDGLGLGRIGSSVELVDNSCTRGMIDKVRHIVRVEEIPAPATSKKGHDETAAGKASPAPAVEPASAEPVAPAVEEQAAVKRQRRPSTKRTAATSEE